LQSDVEDNAEFLEWFSFAMDGAALTGVIIVSTVAISFDHVYCIVHMLLGYMFHLFYSCLDIYV